MTPRTYDREGALRLLPLLESIGREIVEREEVVRRIEEELRGLDGRGKGWSRRADALTAEAAVHKRELRLARTEIEHLGCSLVGHHPPTVRIPGEVHSWLWQLGLPTPSEAGTLEWAEKACDLK